MTHPVRILIHSTQDEARYVAVTELLMNAARKYPDTFEVIVGRPNTIDHVGYHNPTLSSVVWSREPNSQYMRLTVRPDLHPVFEELLQAAIS